MSVPAQSRGAEFKMPPVMPDSIRTTGAALTPVPALAAPSAGPPAFPELLLAALSTPASGERKAVPSADAQPALPSKVADEPLPIATGAGTAKAVKPGQRPSAAAACRISAGEVQPAPPQPMPMADPVAPIAEPIVPIAGPPAASQPAAGSAAAKSRAADLQPKTVEHRITPEDAADKSGSVAPIPVPMVPALAEPSVREVNPPMAEPSVLVIQAATPSDTARPVATARSPASVTNSATPAAQIADRVTVSSTGSGDSRHLVIRLDPIELGQVKVTIETPKDGPATVRLVVERPETLLLLLRDQSHLNHALTQAGLPEQNREVTIALADPAAPAVTPTNTGHSAGLPSDPDFGGDRRGSQQHDTHGAPRREFPASSLNEAAMIATAPLLRPAPSLAGVDITA